MVGGARVAVAAVAGAATGAQQLLSRARLAARMTLRRGGAKSGMLREVVSGTAAVLVAALAVGGIVAERVGVAANGIAAALGAAIGIAPGCATESAGSPQGARGIVMRVSGSALVRGEARVARGREAVIGSALGQGADEQARGGRTCATSAAANVWL